jgi:tetratricopeptide (TPR) repeat protein
MFDHQRIDDLRRRVEHDPASIAFAELAEELRRSGQIEEAIETCRTGLSTHPGHVSARVTLGRALIGLDRLDEAQAELERVLRSAPENVTAVRGLADISRRRGNLLEALMRYRAALSLLPDDPELQRIVVALSREIAAVASPPDRASSDVPHVSRSSPLDPQPPPSVPLHAERDRAERTIAALEQFLGAIRSTTRLSE